MSTLRTVFVAILIVLQCSCIGGDIERFVTSNHTGDATLVIDVFGARTHMLIGIWPDISNAPVYRWQLSGRDITSFWVGWPTNGKYFSVLACGLSFTSIERFSLEDVKTEGNLTPDFSESDSALFTSMRKAFMDQYKVRDAKTNQQLVDWFCDGGGAAAFKKRYIDRPTDFGKMGKVIRLP